MNNYFTRATVWSEGDPLPPPLVDGAPPSVPEYDGQPEPPPLRPVAVLARLWYIVHISIIGAALITVISGSDEVLPLTAWQAIPLGSAAALLLWGITLTVRSRARREDSNV